MRKISAHYCLMPDGTLGRWPVIVTDAGGVIKNLKVNSDHLSEEPGLEYYGGVLVPGFIEDLRDRIFPGLSAKEMVKLTDRFYSKGSTRFLCRPGQNFFHAAFKGKVFYDSSFVSKYEKPYSEMSFWEKAVNENDGDIISVLYSLQNGLTERLPVDVRWGRMEPGADPGIILVKGLDYNGMKLTNKTSIKILIP